MLCAEMPTISLLKRVADEMQEHLLRISDDGQYKVTTDVDGSAILVSDDSVAVRVILTTPLLSDPQHGKYISNEWICLK